MPYFIKWSKYFKIQKFNKMKKLFLTYNKVPTKQKTIINQRVIIESQCSVFET